MQTTQSMMGFKAAGTKLMPLISRYINVFVDSEGKYHYSTEQFNINQDGLYNFDAALQDAYEHTIRGEWEYVETLASHAPESFTLRIEKHLERLEAASQVIAAFGKELPTEWEQAEELAQELVQRDRSRI